MSRVATATLPMAVVVPPTATNCHAKKVLVKGDDVAALPPTATKPDTSTATDATPLRGWLWQCPACGHKERQPFAKAMAHPCPAKRRKLVEMRPSDAPD